MVVFYNQLASVQSMVHYNQEMEKSALRQMMFDVARTYTVEEREFSFQEGLVKVIKDAQENVFRYEISLFEDDNLVVFYYRKDEKDLSSSQE